jgi:hypothetical protein
MPRDLWDTRDALRRAGRERLTAAEWAWAYNAPLLLPIYVTLTVLAGDAEAAIASVAVAHGAVWCAETGIEPGGRRAKAVLARRLRKGHHVWSAAEGDRVRVYALERERPRLPGPFAGVRVTGGREFHVSDEAEAAHAYAAELEAAARGGADDEAAALARVINDDRAP